MREDGSENYQNCRIDWSVYGENGSYRAKVSVTIHAKDVIVYSNTSNVHNTVEEAKREAVGQGKEFIDAQIRSGALKPII
jgi:hypothetical protein